MNSQGFIAVDYVGERFARLFGLTDSKYQYVLDEYNNMKEEVNFQCLLYPNLFGRKRRNSRKKERQLLHLKKVLLLLTNPKHCDSNERATENSQV